MIQEEEMTSEGTPPEPTEESKGVSNGPPTDIPPGPAPIELEATFPEVRRLKIVGTALFVVTGLSAIAPSLLTGSPTTSPQAMITLVLAVSGLTVCLAGLFVPVTRRLAMVVGPIILVGAAGANPLGADLGTIPTIDFVFAFVFAITWLLGVEHLHAVTRFVELGAYVTRQRLTTFRLSSVVNHFQIYGLGMAGLILLVTAIVVIGIPWALGQGGNEVFNRSAELSSVFGIALAAALVFTLAGMILVFLRSVMPQRVDVERVAYSRDRMEDMLRGSQVMERQEGER